tara:strand:+ start:4111 stop:4614 length:504 start_codon:yes stop_codon:yes gene_type:complete
MKTLKEFIAARRSELLSEIAVLQAEIDQLDAAEKAALDVVGTVSEIKPERLVFRTQIRERKPSLTIKEMILNILRDNTAGLQASEIIERIGVLYGKRIPRTSMSPQLSRLKNDGELVLEDSNWILSELVDGSKIETPSEDQSEGVSNNTGEDDASPYESRKIGDLLG